MLRFLIFVLTLSGVASAQETLTPNDIADPRVQRFAITNALIHVSASQQIQNATLLIEDGVVISVEAGIAIPDGFVALDFTGRTIYPAFIDLNSSYGLPEPKTTTPTSFFRQPEVLAPQEPGSFAANDAIRSQYRAAAALTVNTESAQKLRAQGFGLVLSARKDGIARGTSTLVSLGDTDIREAVLTPDAARHFSLMKGSSRQIYPISKMGAVALLRQTFLDASWYSGQLEKSFTDQSLLALNATGSLPNFAQAQDWRDTLRLAAIGDEFDIRFTVQTNGDSYQRIASVKSTGLPLIVPVNFPKAQALTDEYAAQSIQLRELLHWELAPTNPATLETAGIRFALTAHGGEDEFLDNLRLAVDQGLSASGALTALTITPARIIGIDDRVGTLAAGKRADFFVTQGDLFERDSRMLESWIAGQRHPIAAFAPDLAGSYVLQVPDHEPQPFTIGGKPWKPEIKWAAATEDSPKSVLDVDEETVTIGMPDFTDTKSLITLDGWKASGENSNLIWNGMGSDTRGNRFTWSIEKLDEQTTTPTAESESQPENASDSSVGHVIYPFEAYGQAGVVEARDVVIRNATIWTNESDGVLANSDLILRGGKIAEIGPGLDGAGLEEIDASGRHLTAGIIDEHSHIALSSTNDLATNSAMVRMSDAIDSDDIDIYRNLAGGVTAAQLLHGSANPIGGQSAIVKLRWGALPHEMLVEQAPGFIKFALGENVKRSSNAASIRYPQSRMGVEQVFVDAFNRAQAYGRQHADYKRLSRRQKINTPAPRRDLTLEPLVEILNGERLISAHSYVQSEINMLMHVAGQFDFTVNTFTHILEGYKVADKMAAHGAGGSTFSDSWAYKWEVRYAIPYNANLMSQAGVVTAINSDSAETSRRLNQEAAKSIKYGGMEETEALKLVTLNPARLLHLEDTMGSIKVGKDADIVIWSHHPLSIDARAEFTFVDGAPLFDHQRDRKLRAEIQRERARLIAKMRQSKRKAKAQSAAGSPSPAELQCDSLEQRYANGVLLLGEQS